MKQIQKKIQPIKLSSIFICSLLITSFAFLFIGCEESIFEAEPLTNNDQVSPSNETPGGIVPLTAVGYSHIANNADTPSSPSEAFNFEFKIDNCTVIGKSITGVVDNIALYTYSWKVDGQYAGYKDRVECVTGSVIKLTVTRISDGIAHTKSLLFKKTQNAVSNNNTEYPPSN